MNKILLLGIWGSILERIENRGRRKEEGGMIVGRKSAAISAIGKRKERRAEERSDVRRSKDERDKRQETRDKRQGV
jgi:hypothetical protein